MRGGIRPNVRLHAATRPFIAMLIVLVTVLGVGLTPRTSYAEPMPGLPCEKNLLPSGEVTLVCIQPETWNGDLVVYAHGFVDPKADLTLPAELNLFIIDPSTGLPTSTPNPASIPALLLANGYAFATTSYEKNGYVVEQGGNNIDALVESVKSYVQIYIPQKPLNRVYLVGTSYGGLISTMLVELYPTKYSGALAMCGPLGGATDEIKYLGDFGNVFQYFFPEQTAAMQAPNLTNDDRAQIIIDTLSKPQNARAVRQLFSVTGAAFDPRPQNLQTSIISSTVQIMFYSTPAVQADLKDTTGGTTGGNPYDNWNKRYRGSLNDRALNTGIARFQGDQAAMDYVAKYYTPKANLKVPLVTLHNLLDPVVPYKNELIYAQLAYKQHSLRWVRSLVSSNLYGHCNFKQTEIVGALSLLGLKFNILPQP